MSSRRRARTSSTSIARQTPSFIVTASGCAPPIPPRPAVSVDPAAQRPAEVLPRQLRERLVRALEDALRPDVDPRAGGHLAVHRQALPLELAEDVPGRPTADEVRVGDQHPRRPLVGPEHGDRLAALDEQRLVVGEAAQLADDRVERLPAPGRATGPAVDDERVGVLGDLRVEVVHQHPQSRLLAPAAAAQVRASRGADGAGAGGRREISGHRFEDTRPRGPSDRQSGRESMSCSPIRPLPTAFSETMTSGPSRWT